MPIRYTHAHNGIMNRRDFDQMVDLLVAMLQKLNAATVEEAARLRPLGAYAGFHLINAVTGMWPVIHLGSIRTITAVVFGQHSRAC